MNDQKQQVAERVKEANNILVTVSANPSVDQLAACIGLTLTLNKMGKHATAVFSGQVPSAIKFLQPEKTIEKNTDSLRDFIIALDKSKADKLRYKVEDKVVKIFITPYRTSITEKDLEFSQGDFNVDVVLALGVHSQADLDQAITSHGRILHDATVVTVNDKPGGELGSINWLDPMASSLSELAVMLVDMLDKSLLDGQIATALLTGIVAETERFSNSKTSPRTMTISAELMTAGANQQLVATKLEAPEPPALPPAPVISSRPIAEVPKEIAAAKAAKTNDGTLEIAHNEKHDTPVAVPAPQLEEPRPEQQSAVPQASEPEPAAPATEESSAELPKPEIQAKPIADEQTLPAPLPEPILEPPVQPPQINIDEYGALSLPDLPDGDTESMGTLPPVEKKGPPSISHHAEAPKMILNPPSLGGQLTANAKPDSYDTSADPLAGGLPSLEAPEAPESHAAQQDESAPIGTTITPPAGQPADTSLTQADAPAPDYMLPSSDPYAAPASPSSTPAYQDDETLSEIERDVHSNHLDEPVLDAALAPASAPDSQPAPAYPPYEPLQATTPPAPALTPEPAPFTPPVSDAPADTSPADLQDARDAVLRAMNNSANPDEALPPVAALNAQPLDLPGLNNPTQASSYDQPVPDMPTPELAPVSTTSSGVPVWDPASGTPPPLQPLQPTYNDANPMAAQAMPGVPGMMPAPYDPAAPQQQAEDPNAPPPVPPPMMPPSFQ